VYINNNKDKIFIKKDVLKKLLNGLIMKRVIIIIEVAQHKQPFLVALEKIIKLNGVVGSIYF